MEKKDIKIGVREGAGCPAYEWSVGILDVAHDEALDVLNLHQYRHLALQVKELARQPDPTHSDTVDVTKVDDFYEIRDKGGVLGSLNIRLFFGKDEGKNWIIILGLIQKQNNGKTPRGDKLRMCRRWRKYRNGDFGKLPL